MFERIYPAFSILDFVKGITFVLRAIEESIKQGCGLSVSQYRILLYLYENDGSRMADAAAVLDLKANTLSLAVAGLERLGLVRRTTSTQDSRAFLLALTDAGQIALKDTGHLLMTRVHALWGPLTHEQRQLVSQMDEPDQSRLPSSEYVLNTVNCGRTITPCLKQQGITVTQYLILAELVRADRALRPVNLEALLDTRSNTIASALASLATDGLVRLKRQTRGRLMTEVSATAKGTGLMQQASQELERALWERLTERFEETTIRGLLEANANMVAAFT
ncbi:MAG: MarR family transcriptional regulator [Coriobacteriales bacterium]|jgi:DNA-binding MarR family transcriptional regulator|nr:MarR family transcriptional regulator [Coriobacteriales bacterium]